MITIRAKKLSSGKYSLYLDIYENGQRKKEYLKIYVEEDYTKPIRDKNGNIVRDKRDKPKYPKIQSADKANWKIAESIRAQRQLELNSENHNLFLPAKEKADFVEYFENWCKKKNNPSYDGALKHFKDFAGNSTTFKSITLPYVEKFKTHLLSKLSNNTANTYLKRVQIIWNEAINEKITSRNPFSAVGKIKTQTAKRDFLTAKELQKLASAKTKTAKLTKQAFFFACYTGLRYSDILKLTWNEVKIDGENKRIEFRQKKSAKEVLSIPLNSVALGILESLNNTTPLVFEKLSPNNGYINRQLRDWQQDAGLTKHLHFHIARHTFATLALSNDADLFTVSKLLGHKSIKTTQIYAKIVDQKKKDAINKLPEINL